MLTRNVSPWCFFLSIIAAFERFGEGDHNAGIHSLAHGSMLVAAVLPVIAAGVRTVRAAHEFGRNQLRFEAMSHYLSILITDVSQPMSPSAAIPILREAEHRAWLHLMLDAEWFG